MQHRDAFLFVRQAVSAFIRELPTNVISIVSIGLLLFMLSCVFIGWFNVEAIVTAVRDEAEIVVYVKDNVTEMQIEQAIDKLKHLDEVTRVRYVDADTAKQQMEHLIGSDLPLAAFGDHNPFLAFIEVGVVPDQATSVIDIATSLPGVDGVRDNELLLSQLTVISQVVRWAGTVFALAMVVMVALSVAQIIRLGIHAKRDDITVLRLLGAREWFVAAPFMIEGVIISIIGGMIGTILLWVLMPPILQRAASALAFLPLIPWSQQAVLMSVITIAVAFISGLVGSLASIRACRDRL